MVDVTAGAVASSRRPLKTRRPRLKPEPSIPQELRIRLVTWDDDPPIGGQGVYARELRRALSERGISVSTLAGRGRFAMPYPRITNRPHLDMSIALNRSVKALLDADPDLVHLSGGPGGLQLLRRVEVPVVFTAHHTFRQAHRRPSARRAYGAIEARSYARAAAVAAVSRSTADALLAMGVRHEKVVVISPGVRLDHAGLDGRERQPGRMLFVGRLEPEKRPLDAITAMMDVAGSVPGARGYVVGTGSMSSAVATAAGDTSGRVTFRGRLTDDEIAEEYRRAQVVLMPSDYEGLGIVALEATAAGAVVVGYDVDGLHDAIGASECLVPHGDVCALASTTRRVMTDSSLREDIVHRCLETIRNGRSWEGCARDFEHLYRNLLVA